MPSIRDIAESVWDQLSSANSSLYVSHRWLRWAQDDSSFCSRYLLARDAQDRLVGALPCYLLEREARSVDAWYDPMQVFVRPHVSKPADGSNWFPVLLLGSRSGYHGDVLVDPQLSSEQQSAVVRALIDASEHIAVEFGARSRALMYVAAPTANATCRLGGRSGRTVPTSAEAVINTRWDSFDEYLLQFAKKRRTNIRRELSTFAGANVLVREMTLAQSYELVGPLLGRLQRKYGLTDTDQELTRRMAAQAAVLNDISRVFLGVRDGKVVGFSLCYEWRRQLYVRSTGFDGDAGSAPFAYFNLALYAPLRYAIDHRLNSVNVGVSAYRAKIARGAQLSPLWSVLWPPSDADPASLSALEQPAAEAAEAENLIPGTFALSPMSLGT
jgi:predicted N-acyltransferase